MQIFNSWLLPLLQQGNKRDLGIEDLYVLPSCYKAEPISKGLKNEWTKETHYMKNTSKKSPSLFRCIWKAFGLEFIILGILLFIEVCILK